MAEKVGHRTPSPISVGPGTRIPLLYFLAIAIGATFWNLVVVQNSVLESIQDSLVGTKNASPTTTTTTTTTILSDESIPKLVTWFDRAAHASMSTTNFTTAGITIPNSKQRPTTTTQKTTIAFAVTVTKFESGKNLPKITLYDRAAVLHKSIKSAMKRSQRYDYHLYAFVHPDAIEIQPMFEQLGYKVQIRDTPFNLTEIPNQSLIDVQDNSCCGEKEYLKLYSYLLLDYPVAVHVDMDYLVLKPMDGIFDLMIDPSYNRTKFQHSAMWANMQEYNGSIDALYTRDYRMVKPPFRQVHQIGFQGGFLVIRPNREDFEKLINIILSGGNFTRNGWGDQLKYGGYYGSGTIQGLASYYYGHLEPNRAIELNRCYYNTMVDDPIYYHKERNFSMCRTLEPDLNCQDCRTTKLEEIYSAHFTLCGKPEYCELRFEIPLCRELFLQWHATRTSIEKQWEKRFPGYQSGVPTTNFGNGTGEREEMMRNFGGHCGPIWKPNGRTETKYHPMVFPSQASETERLL